MFWTRFRSSVILMAITILVIVLGGNVLFGTILAISLVGMMELLRIYRTNRTLLGVVGYLGCIAYYVMIFLKQQEHHYIISDAT